MSRFADDQRPEEANARAIFDVAEQLQISLGRGRIERVGPCPHCGGEDRFSLNSRKNCFNCRRCGGKGGPIDLVMFVLGLSFPAALDWMCGARHEIDPAELAERAKRADESRVQREAYAEKSRREAIAAARKIWLQGVIAEGTPVRGYLEVRGIEASTFPKMPACLRFHPDLAYTVEAEAGGFEVIHRGPAMLAAVQGMDGRFCAVHRTWIDLEKPKGKAHIVHPRTGKVLKVKKSLGSIKGGAIRLTHAEPHMVVGEGIETTLSALVAGGFDGAGFWCGVSLGNMCGERAPEAGRATTRASSMPDMSDDAAFVPPPEAVRLTYLQDGDSDPVTTRAKLVAGLRRAMALRPGLRGEISAAPKGMDFNDLLLGGENG